MEEELIIKATFTLLESFFLNYFMVIIHFRLIILIQLSTILETQILKLMKICHP